MKKTLFVFFLVTSSLAVLQKGSASSPLAEQFPPAYEAYSRAVYSTTASQKELDGLFEKAQNGASDYDSWEKDALLALCYFMKGMESYFTDDYKTAGSWFDQAQKTMELSIEKNQNAFNTAYLTQIIMQNAAVKGFSFQIKYVPGLPKLIEKALTLDPHCTQALYMRNFYNCTVPIPYGKGYLVGADSMAQLLASEEKKSEIQKYLILSARGYALSKKNKKAEAVECYEQALEIFPNNSETLRALAELKK